MAQLRQFLAEIHRRSLWQVLGVYVAASWVIYQVVVALYEGIGLPDWLPPTALALLLVFLPVVLATAFIQEGGPRRAGDRGPEPPADHAGHAGHAAAADMADPGAASSSITSPPTAPPPDRRDPSPPTPATATRPRALFTWSRAITLGVLAFALLGLATTGFMGMRALGVGPAATLVSAGALEERDPLVLADFANATADSTLGVTVTETVRTELERSDVLRLVSATRVADALRRMERDPAAPLTPDVAREIAVRDGYKAYLEGEVRELGGRYLLAARVVRASDGEVLASFQQRAGDAGEIIGAIDGLTRDIRGKVGESLASVRKEPPLPQTTSASLTALAHLAQGLHVFDRTGDQLAALRHFEAAVEEDSTFAAAWVTVGLALGNMGIQLDRRQKALERAYRYRDRLTEAERQGVAAFYHTDQGDIDRAIDAYEAFLALDSTSNVAAGAANNVALLYRRQRNHDRAVEMFRRSIRINAEANDGGTPLEHTNLITQLTYAGRFDEARAAVAELVERFPDHRRTHAMVLAFAGMDGDYEALDSLARAHQRRFGDALEGRTLSRRSLGYLAALQGRARDLESHFGEIEREAARAGWDGQALRAAVNRVRIRALMDQDFAAAVAELDALRDHYGYDTIPPRDVPYQALAHSYARFGATDRAREILADYRREIPLQRRESNGSTAAVADALVALHEGRIEDAGAALDVADRRDFCDFCRLPYRALLAEHRGEADRAAELYTRYLEQPWLHRLDDDANHRVFVTLRLADLHEEAGRTAEAARYHAEFVRLWNDADPELQPRVDAARRALARLAGDAG